MYLNAKYGCSIVQARRQRVYIGLSRHVKHPDLPTNGIKVQIILSDDVTRIVIIKIAYNVLGTLLKSVLNYRTVAAAVPPLGEINLEAPASYNNIQFSNTYYNIKLLIKTLQRAKP